MMKNASLSGWKPLAMAGLLAGIAPEIHAENPYLWLESGTPRTERWTGTEWGDEIASANEEGRPLQATVTTRLLADTGWGQIVRVRFEAGSARVIPPLYLLVREGVILELVPDDGDIEYVIGRVAGMKKPPHYEDTDVRAASNEGRNVAGQAPWSQEVTTADGTSTFLASHPSGHFRKLVWRKGRGLVEYASGYGARKDGFRLAAGGGGGTGGVPQDSTAPQDDPDDPAANERIGALALGLSAQEVLQHVPGNPVKGVDTFFGADGEWHQDWKWASLGIEVDMVSAKENGAKTVGGVMVTAPSQLRTRRWIGVGSSLAETEKAYAGAINREESRAGESLVIGSIYGGLIFGLKDGKVESIFLGAAAE